MLITNTRCLLANITWLHSGYHLRALWFGPGNVPTVKEMVGNWWDVVRACVLKSDYLMACLKH